PLRLHRSRAAVSQCRLPAECVVRWSFALHAPLPAAIRAAFTYDLPGALAVRARARNREEALLISKLPASAACLARRPSSAFLCTRSVARSAELLPRHLDFGRDTRRRFLERQCHVVAQVSATLRSRAASTPSAAKNVFEPEKVTEDVVEVLKYRA